MSSLELIIGPMFSGKTTELINRYNTLKINNSDDKILLINHLIDSQRYKHNSIVSHNGIEIPAISITKLGEANKEIEINKNICYILINEGQFFEDLYEWVINILDNTHISIIICGLDSDYRRMKFGKIWNLFPHANNIYKLSGKCNNCSNLSIYTHRISHDDKQVVVGTINYIPLCRTCYIKQNM